MPPSPSPITFERVYEILFNPIQYGGHYAPPNFVVSSSITIKFGIDIEFDKFSPK